MGLQDDLILPQWVPLFPLPNVVLLPRAILPLHIFEDRYRRMTADALSSDRLIAMALLKPGWEKAYHGRPSIEDVVCVGKILQHERLDDGRYNLLLQGLGRAKIRTLDDQLPYRRGHLEWIRESSVLEIDLADQRQKLRELFDDNRIQNTDLTRQLRRLVDSAVTTPDLADILAFSLLNNLQDKQSLLAEADVARRVEKIIDLLSRAYPAIPQDAQGLSRSILN